MAPFVEARDRLDTITGVGKRAAECIIAEIGVDMTRFPTAGHLASWAGIAPGQQHHRRQTPLGQDHQGQPVARRHPQPVRLVRRPLPQHLPRQPSTGDWPDASARRKPPSRSATPSWSSAGTCSPTTPTTTTSAATTSPAATPTATTTASSANSTTSATKSPWSSLRKIPLTLIFFTAEDAAIPASCAHEREERTALVEVPGTHGTAAEVDVAPGQTAPAAVRLGAARGGHRHGRGSRCEGGAVAAPEPAGKHDETAHDQGDHGQPFEEQDRTQRDDDAHRGTRHGDAQQAWTTPDRGRSSRGVGGADAPGAEIGEGPGTRMAPTVREVGGPAARRGSSGMSSGVPEALRRRGGIPGNLGGLRRDSSDQVSERVVTSTPSGETPPASVAAATQQCTQSWNWISRATPMRL